MSLGHIQAAALFARQAYEIEAANDGKFNENLDAHHRSYVLGAIICATSFLESSINELFADALEGNTGNLKGIEESTVTALALEVPRMASIIEKFEIALTRARKPLLKKGIRPSQDIEALTHLRNCLVHYKPEWSESDAPRENGRIEGKMEKLLKRRFRSNPLTGEGNPFWPHKALGHGCAEWAVQSSLSFTDEFYGRLGLTPIPYNHIKPQIITRPRTKPTEGNQNPRP